MNVVVKTAVRQSRMEKGCEIRKQKHERTYRTEALPSVTVYRPHKPRDAEGGDMAGGECDAQIDQSDMFRNDEETTNHHDKK